ncbi:tetratricopeptide repeat protein, partial [Calidithermus terrae]|uniref:tetratricopeptide repeat protein n=1 Tax=Calidithermus terrae TaxID=1408545 RepID=UPI0011C390EE
PQALNLARAAAVAGTAFDLRLAAAVLERPPLELAAAHAELEAAQVLRGSAFTHDLVHEAVLAGTPPAVRQVLHGRTAQHLEAAGANPALVGQHWLEAGEGDKAARWLIQAAFEASALGLYKEVIELLERASAAAGSPALRLEARVHLADALGPVGRVEESVRTAREVLAQTSDPRLRQRALSVLQNMYHGLGDYEAASAAIAEALELALELGEEDRAAAMRFAQARIARSAGRYAEAAGLLESILPFYRQAPSRADLIQVLTLLGNTYNLVGRHAEAEPLLHEAFVIREPVGPAVQILAVSSWLYCLLCLGRPQEVLPEAEAALTLGDYAIADHLRNNLSLAYLHLGRPAEARAHCQVLAEKAFDPNYRCMAWARLAALRAGSPEGEAALEHALRLHPEAKTPAARFTLIQAALAHGSPEQQAWAQQELQTLDPTTLPWLLQPDYQRLKHP